MEKRKPWVPKKKQLLIIKKTFVGQHLPPATRREYIRGIKGRAMLNRVFQPMAEDYYKRPSTQKLLLREKPIALLYCGFKSFGIRPLGKKQRQLSFEENARLVIRGLHLHSFRRYWEPLVYGLVAEFVKQNPKKFGELLGKNAGLFSRDMGRDIFVFLNVLGPKIKPFLAGLGPNAKELAQGMRENIGFYKDLSRQYSEDFANGLGKYADSVADTMKAGKVDSETIKLLTGKAR